MRWTRRPSRLRRRRSRGRSCPRPPAYRPTTPTVAQTGPTGRMRQRRPRTPPTARPRPRAPPDTWPSSNVPPPLRSEAGSIAAQSAHDQSPVRERTRYIRAASDMASRRTEATDPFGRRQGDRRVGHEVRSAREIRAHGPWCDAGDAVTDARGRAPAGRRVSGDTRRRNRNVQAAWQCDPWTTPPMLIWRRERSVSARLTDHAPTGQRPNAVHCAGQCASHTRRPAATRRDRPGQPAVRATRSVPRVWRRGVCRTHG
jgi:hypothetical protein